MKKAQFDQPFLVIFSVVVLATVILLGIFIIIKVMDTKETLEINNFKQDLKKEVDRFSGLDPGSDENLEFVLTKDLQEVCFVDDTAKDFSTISTQAKDLITRLEDNNIIFVSKPGRKTLTPFNINNLKPSRNPLCIRLLNNKLNLNLKTETDFVLVSPKVI